MDDYTLRRAMDDVALIASQLKVQTEVLIEIRDLLKAQAKPAEE